MRWFDFGSRHIHEHLVSLCHQNMADFGPPCLVFSANDFPESALLGIQERPLFVAFPEVGEDDHTCNRRVRTP
jgi:hypothetical protein